MDLQILDENTFYPVGLVDNYESLIWTDRFSSCGDFEITLDNSPANMELLKKNRYTSVESSDHLMIIETRQLTKDLESGEKLLVSGRSLESILDRRIVWTPTILSGFFQTEIHRLLIENVIDPVDVTRKIPNFIFESSTDNKIIDLKIEQQLYGDNLYDVISQYCIGYKIGFKMYINHRNEIVFKLYAGVDRSYAQVTNPQVVFSTEFENLIKADYIESNKQAKTVSLVIGEDPSADSTNFSFDAV